MLIPLFDQKRVVGVLNVESTKETSLEEADLKLMTALGDHLEHRYFACPAERGPASKRGTLPHPGGKPGEKRGIAIVDSTETFRFANAAAEEVFGVGRGKLVGQNLQSFLSEKEFQRVRLETEKRQRGETSTFEQQIVRPEGTVRWIELTASPQFDQAGAFSHTLGIFRDITESKNAQQSLRESEERFRRLFEDSPIGIAFLGAQREITLTNPRYRDFLGLNEAEIITRAPSASSTG